MKKMVIVMIGVSLFICLFSFLGIIHSPIHYSKRDLMLVNAEFMIDEDVDIKLMKLESIWVSKTAYYPLKALLKQAKLEHVVLSVEKGMKGMTFNLFFKN